MLGLGRLGGGALTHASDLDLVYLFTGDHGRRESDGRRPLGATLYFNRLAQRVTAALSVPTAEGALYEVDTRLRPSGAQGPLAVSFDAFARYQREQAWTWEHMALTRARPLFGSAQDARAHCRDRRRGRCGRGRAPEPAARRRARDARARWCGTRPPRGRSMPSCLRGGLVDLEFLVHFQQLRLRTRSWSPPWKLLCRSDRGGAPTCGACRCARDPGAAAGCRPAARTRWSDTAGRRRSRCLRGPAGLTIGRRCCTASRMARAAVAAAWARAVRRTVGAIDDDRTAGRRR